MVLTVGWRWHKKESKRKRLMEVIQSVEHRGKRLGGGE